MPNPQTIGIMFDECRNTPFPALTHAVYYSCEDAPEYADWLAVAADPNRMRYFDDDAQAMDETNWNVIVGALDEAAEYCNPDSAYSRSCAGTLDMSEEITTAGYAFYHDTFQTFLIVSPDNEELLDTMISLRSSLADYPILDEMEYSKRETEAWDEWMLRGGLESDTLRELADQGADEDTLDTISEAWADLAPQACEHLDYWYGFTGEHSPVFSVCIARVIGDAITATIARSLVGEVTR
jgi:hypothetical protein